VTAQPVAVRPSTDHGGSVSMESGTLPRASPETSRHGRAATVSDSTEHSYLTTNQRNVLNTVHISTV